MQLTRQLSHDPGAGLPTERDRGRVSICQGWVAKCLRLGGINQRSSPFLAPGAGSVEDSFSTGCERWFRR